MMAKQLFICSNLTMCYIYKHFLFLSFLYKMRVHINIYYHKIQTFVWQQNSEMLDLYKARYKKA